MTRTGWIGVALAVAGIALVAAIVLERSPEETPIARAEPAIRAPGVAADSGPGATAAPVPATRSAAVRAALTQAFRDAPLDPALLGRLLDGDVAATASALAASDAPGAAAELATLGALCAELVGRPGADEARGAIASTTDAGARAAVEAASDALRRWAGRAAGGCLAPALGAGELHARLARSAAAGDAASLERLAAEDPEPEARLASAALLGNARAQLRLALAHLTDQPATARAWLEASAKREADAAAYAGSCLAAGCFGAADPEGGRQALRAAALRGSLLAFGPLTGASSWPVAALPALPGEGRVHPGDAVDRYAFASLAAGLARDGCFGAAFALDAAAFATLAERERELPTAALADARRAADVLAAEARAPLKRALGCD